MRSNSSIKIAIIGDIAPRGVGFLAIRMIRRSRDWETEIVALTYYGRFHAAR